MSVTVRRYRGKSGGWHVDVRVRLPDGERWRERTRQPISKSAAKRWGEDRERFLLQHGPPQPTREEVPTLEQFAPRFLDGHPRANRQKPSGIAAKEMILRIHLIPSLGGRTLDGITNEHVQQLKLAMHGKAAKTVNNVLTVLNVLLRKAVEWGVIERMPCVIRLLPIAKTMAAFHDFEDYERLVEAAQALGSETHLMVLLGGEAGLRCGEIMALEWADVDLAKRQLCVRRSEWNGQVTVPKGGRIRYVPLTVRLTAALREHRHLRSSRILCNDDGTSLTRPQVQYRINKAAQRAHVGNGVHVLRHTFCSHLAMRGAPGLAIQLLAGHSELSMTQNYMHLTPAALDAAIQLLESRGNIGATPSVADRKASV